MGSQRFKSTSTSLFYYRVSVTVCKRLHERIMCTKLLLQIKYCGGAILLVNYILFLFVYLTEANGESVYALTPYKYAGMYSQWKEPFPVT